LPVLEPTRNSDGERDGDRERPDAAGEKERAPGGTEQGGRPAREDDCGGRGGTGHRTDRVEDAQRPTGSRGIDTREQVDGDGLGRPGAGAHQHHRAREHHERGVDDEDERTWADFPRECCGETHDDALAWAIHRTEAHDTPQATLGHLEKGEFEEHVNEAETIGDLREAVGWSNERLFRALNIYGLADVVGPSGPDIVDVDAGDDGWKRLYQDVATDGGSR